MTINLNGRLIAGFLLGALCGALGTAVPLVNSTQRQIRVLENEKAALTGNLNVCKRDNERTGLQMGEAYRELQSVKDQCYGRASVVSSSQPSNPSETLAVAMWNRIFPGAGDMLKKIAEQSPSRPVPPPPQDRTPRVCPAGQLPTLGYLLDANYQGIRCGAEVQ